MTLEEYKEQKYELQVVINWLSKYEEGSVSPLVEHNTTGFGRIKHLYELAKKQQRELSDKFREGK